MKEKWKKQSSRCSHRKTFDKFEFTFSMMCDIHIGRNFSAPAFSSLYRNFSVFRVNYAENDVSCSNWAGWIKNHYAVWASKSQWNFASVWGERLCVRYLLYGFVHVDEIYSNLISARTSDVRGKKMKSVGKISIFITWSGHLKWLHVHSHQHRNIPEYLSQSILSHSCHNA